MSHLAPECPNCYGGTVCEGYSHEKGGMAYRCAGADCAEPCGTRFVIECPEPEPPTPGITLKWGLGNYAWREHTRDVYVDATEAEVVTFGSVGEILDQIAAQYP